MTDTASAARQVHPAEPSPSGSGPSAARGRRWSSHFPTWGLIATKQLELRKRRGLMLAVAVLIVGVPALILGANELLHLVNQQIGPPPGPSGFAFLSSLAAEFGFIAAAALGTAAATTDLREGVFRHLVVTGRSRLALYLARIPAGLSIVLPLVAVAFTLLCLVTSYAGTAQPGSIGVNGVADPGPPRRGAASRLACSAPPPGEPRLRPWQRGRQVRPVHSSRDPRPSSHALPDGEGRPLAGA